MTGQALVLGVAGGSGSGKTTLVNALLDTLDRTQVVLLPCDAYYKDRSHLGSRERSQVNYDHPEALDLPLLRSHLLALRKRQSIPRPVYDFGLHCRRSETVLVSSQQLIVVEGILVLADAGLRELLDLKVFLDASPKRRFLRRLERDVRERGRSVFSVASQYLKTVRPMYRQFVEPSRHFADIEIRTGGEVSDSLQDLLGFLEKARPDLLNRARKLA